METAIAAWEGLAQREGAAALGASVTDFMESAEDAQAQLHAFRYLQEALRQYPEQEALSALQEAFWALPLEETISDQEQLFELQVLRAEGISLHQGDDAAVDYAMGQLYAGGLNEASFNIPLARRLPAYLVSAGRDEEMQTWLDDVWIENPNSFGLLLDIAQSAALSYHSSNQKAEAFFALDQLRTAYPVEFLSSASAVQNYLDSASSADFGDDPVERRLRLQDALDFALLALNQTDFGAEGLDAAMYLQVAKLYHELLDTENALRFYQLAKDAAPGGQFEGQILALAQQSISGLRDGNIDPVLASSWEQGDVALATGIAHQPHVPSRLIASLPPLEASTATVQVEALTLSVPRPATEALSRRAPYLFAVLLVLLGSALVSRVGSP